ncbi:MAG: asparagine synthase (glutamine-hydrolyzing) [Magnetococcales bacterium]|nr:asparagine synthase (glutamine-hydrolyzing) [Magnetococcales bacterium]
MCGIAGIIGRGPPDRERIFRTLEAMRHRGPDSSGFLTGRMGEYQATLLHTRLSIIELDERANQPFSDGSCHLVYNGEIYNYLELREELETAGHRFRTRSDTEVVLKAYRQWGSRCFERLYGMWALALLDETEGRLLLSRDPFGEKPLYCAQRRGEFYFASEVKAINSLSGTRPEVNPRKVCTYLVLGFKSLYKDRNETFYRDISEFPPASCAEFVAPECPVPRRYWEPAYRPQPMTEGEALEGVRPLLFQVVKEQLRADVPIAFCLSGGVDSTTLASIAGLHLGHRINSFSIIDQDDRYDETENIDLMVDHLGCDHTVIRTRTDNFLERLGHLVQHFDAPVSTISYYLHAFLSEAIHGAGFKVAISGTGGDEVFGGYYHHYLYWLADMASDPDFPRLVEDWRTGMGQMVRNPQLQNPRAFIDSPASLEHLTLNSDRFRALMRQPFDGLFDEKEYSDSLLRKRTLNELHHETIPSMLHDEDHSSMMFSLENRTPFLDRRLVEFLYSVPVPLLIRNGFTKWLLREAGAGLVPDRVRLDKHKRGFNASILSLLDRSDPRIKEYLLAPSPLFDLVDRQRLEEVLESDLSANSMSKFMFSFVSIKLFMDHQAGMAL